MNPRRVSLLVGLVLALGTGLLMINYLSSLRAAVDTGGHRTVVVALNDIPARATITAKMLATAERPATQVDRDAFARPADAIGSISLITIPAGSAITQSKIGHVGVLALPRRLTNGLRAVSISIDKVKGVSGLIQPGDRVDVIAVPPRVGNETPRATAILRGALVLALGGETEGAHATPPPDNQNVTTVTLAVTPKQADLLALADVNTTLRLALRPPQEPIHAYPAEALQLGLQPQPVMAAAPAAPARTQTVVRTVTVPSRPAAAPYSVPVIDGDRYVTATGTGK